ncbi:hypothetical protein P168DRAFT_137771 [Aspergillus campestris IBT 28561]|uniref:IgE-binding protein n=1 Tax=Aspergillus campestris (strain IBT 28561) TaxID=1392248 RepID=A0A2I1D4C6_ASPC2|nr:uncharacterized protein P168DRAFT_137771 [Aspergillus campestris IBT 28561]PKY04708.1 hypothetical protein P168DRAFT_137771 [Aspergillus campestris IBT 28561]
MKLQIVASLLPLLASAAPTAESAKDAAPEPAFGVMAVRSASPIHFLPMTAASQKFWLGGETSSYCPTPPVPKEDCPPGTDTVFSPGGYALNVMVPGGQRIYVDPTGALRFTQAHSGAIPPGSAIGPFEYTPGDSYGRFTFTGFGADGFMACPAEDDRWQVFAAIQNATVPGGDVGACLGFSAIAPTAQHQGFAAWQYN